MAGQWTLNKLRGSPQRIRPETHWFQETRPRDRVGGDVYGRKDGRLWFSLQLTLNGAEGLWRASVGYGMKPAKCARISAVAAQIAILNVSIQPRRA